ncbi:penicillin-binding protein 2 [Janibacter melonis]|uniref:peptidoglycan D,D-transpeptidase FtsI family protein n=1 Tax=Janibacter melonis TaxID=262209 RepID=UPI002044B22D|nr:penicillin-binding protein 2 [Janibacter melonis]MCM3555722.1 penicillin-binding protein 2 [Janibacter melonis]
MTQRRTPASSTRTAKGSTSASSSTSTRSTASSSSAARRAAAKKAAASRTGTTKPTTTRATTTATTTRAASSTPSSRTSSSKASSTKAPTSKTSSAKATSGRTSSSARTRATAAPSSARRPAARTGASTGSSTRGARTSAAGATRRSTTGPGASRTGTRTTRPTSSRRGGGSAPPRGPRRRGGGGGGDVPPAGNPRMRMRGMMVASLFVLSLFAAQLMRIQGFDSAEVAADALAQRTTTESIPARRGTITDAHGTVLASSAERRIVVVDQTAVPAYEKEVGGTRTEVGVVGAAKDLAPLLRQDEDDLVEAMTGERRYVILAKNLSPLTWRKISALGIPGVYSERSSQRTYPQSTTVASLVGFVQPQDQTAGGGLELMLDDTLKGTPGTATYEVAMDGSRLPNAGSDVSSAEPGKDVRLTIDNDVQWYAQNALAAKVEETDALSGTVVVQRVDTGELVALASYPTFDPNDIGDGKGVFANLAFSDAFEPGSTAKIMTVAAGLEEGTITPSSPMVLPDHLQRYDATLRDSHPHPVEYRTVGGALAESSNVGMMLIGETMKPKTLEEYFRKFGLGSKTGSGFPGESEGIMPPSEKWDGVQRYTVTYGQGLSTTAVQVAGVFQTIANKGVRVAPSLVAETSDGEGGWTPAPAAKRERVVSQSTATSVSRMLEGVVSEEGTAPKAKIDGYRVAGKTGTADRYDDKTGGYSGKTASFIGYAPAQDPQLVVAVILQRPVKGYFGGQVAAPVFKDVMTHALQTQEVPPAADDTVKPISTRLKKAPAEGTPGLLKDRGNPGDR